MFDSWFMFSEDVIFKYFFYVINFVGIIYVNLEFWVLCFESEFLGELEVGVDFCIDVLVQSYSLEWE